MTSCTNCAAPLNPGARFCIACGQPVTSQPINVPPVTPALAWAPQPVAQQTPPATPVGSAPAPFADVESALGVRLAPGEVLKRVFPVARLKRSVGWIEGQLAVTDSRLLYRAKAKNWFSESTNYREVQIPDVSGMAMVTRRGLTPLSLLTLVAGFVIGWVAIWLLGTFISTITNPFGNSGPSGWTILLYLLLIVVTVIIGIVRYRSTEVALVVFARGIEASPIALSGSMGRQQAGFLAMSTAIMGGPLLSLAQALGFFDASDASDSVEPASAEAMYDELGALILDLQSRGVMGGE